MHLFAETSGSNPLAGIIVLGLMILSVRNICNFLRGSPIARDTVRRGGLAILRNLFKK